MVTEAGKKGLSTLSIRFGNIGWDSETAHGNALDFQALILNGCLSIGKALELPSWNFECTPVDFASKALVTLASDSATLKEGNVLNCVQDGFTPFKDIFQYLNTVSGRRLSAVNFESWSRALEDAMVSSNNDSVTALFSFVSGLENCQSYLRNVPRLDCSVFDATLAKIDSPLKRSGLVGKSYYETYFKSIVPAGTAVDLDVGENGTGTSPIDIDFETRPKSNGIEGRVDEMGGQIDAVVGKVNAIEGSVDELKEMMSQMMKMMG